MLIKVRVTTGARAETIRASASDRFDISVREKPLQNRANTRIIELIALHFGVPIKRVRITKGHHQKSKILQVTR